MKIKKKRLEVIVQNLLDVLYDEIMCDDVYYKTLKKEVGLLNQEISELENDIYKRSAI